jgi:hypothetical protein
LHSTIDKTASQVYHLSKVFQTFHQAIRLVLGGDSQEILLKQELGNELSRYLDGKPAYNGGRADAASASDKVFMILQFFMTCTSVIGAARIRFQYALGN